MDPISGVIAIVVMWNKFFALCDCLPLKTLAEAEEMFAGFEPL